MRHFLANRDIERASPAETLDIDPFILVCVGMLECLVLICAARAYSALVI